MIRAKYVFPIDVVTKAQLKAAGINTVDDVEHYKILPVDSENKLLDDGGNATDKTLEDYTGQL